LTVDIFDCEDLTLSCTVNAQLCAIFSIATSLFSISVFILFAKLFSLSSFILIFVTISQLRCYSLFGKKHTLINNTDLANIFACLLRSQPRVELRQEGQHPPTGQRAAKVRSWRLTSLNITQMINTIQLPADGRVTCRIGINNSPAFNAGRSVCVQISR